LLLIAPQFLTDTCDTMSSLQPSYERMKGMKFIPAKEELNIDYLNATCVVSRVETSFSLCS